MYITIKTTCPNCGYCPHCGRCSQPFYPYQVPYQNPLTPTAPPWPYTGPIWISNVNTSGSSNG